MTLPISFTAGDTVRYTRRATADHSAATGWTMTVALRGPSTLNVTGAPVGPDWLATITAAQSQALIPGMYAWQVSVIKGAERATLESGALEVLADIALQPAGFDARTQAQRDLAAVQAAIRANIEGGAVAEYTIGSRSLKRLPMADLIALETKLRADVALEDMARRTAAGVGGRNVRVRF